MKIINKRRKQHKTDYGKRRKLLKSEKARIVFRKTSTYLIAQYTTSTHAQDAVKISYTSKNLLNYGWPKEQMGSLKSIPAAYLLGLLIGTNIKDKKGVIVDAGMTRTIYKNRFYGFLKGLIDAGLEITCKEEAFPEQERIEGKHMKKDFSSHFKQIKEKIHK